MKIGLLASTGKHLDSFFVEIIDSMVAGGARVNAAAGSGSTGLVAEVLPGMSQSPRPSSFVALKSLRDWVTRHDLDIVLTNTATASALVRLSGVKVPVVYFCHGLHWNTGHLPSEWVWRFVERSLLRMTSGIITLNSDDRLWFARRAANTPRLHLGSGVGVPQEFFARLPVSGLNSPLRILWIGDFTDRKRPELAIELASRLSLMGMDFVLTMLGNGASLNRIERLVVANGLESLVVLPGRVRSSLTFIDETDLMVHTARWEGLPRVLLEGVARGKRAIGFDVKGVRDIPGVVLVPDRDIEAMAIAVQNVSATGLGTPFSEAGLIESSRVVGRSILHFLESVVAARPGVGK